ncbi:MAG: hypothetical protein ACE5F1_13465 [Planctomycetota bacterium]
MPGRLSSSGSGWRGHAFAAERGVLLIGGRDAQRPRRGGYLPDRE